MKWLLAFCIVCVAEKKSNNIATYEDSFQNGVALNH